MKIHIYILHLLLCITTCSFAQKQITNFDNSVNNQAINPVYQSQIGNRIIYSAFTPANGNELWVSDGTKANTRLLKDIVPGYQGSYPSDFTTLGDLLYFVVDGYEVWKTDGSPSGTEKLLRSDSSLNLNIVSGKLLVTFRNITTQRFTFAWLNADGQTDFLNEDATAFKCSGGNLYYGLYDSTAKKWTLKVFDSQARVLSSTLGPPLNDIVVERQNGYEYIAVDAGYVEKKLVVADIKRAETPKTYNWNRGPAPVMLRDKAGALFLIDGNYATLKILKVVEGHNWETVADVTESMLYANTPKGSNEGPFHTNFVIEGDQLTFTSLFGYESIYSAYLGVFDFKKNVKRISSSLPREVTARTVQVVPQSRDVFEIRYGLARCTYNIAENKPVSVEQLPRPVRKFKVGDIEFELSDNVYVSDNAIRLPLMTRRPVYAEKFLAYRAVLNNKLLFWTNNEEKNTGKLWISDGKSTSELLAFEGTIVSWKMATDSMRVGNQIVFTSWSRQGTRIFKTDGSKAGTREIYFYKREDSPDEGSPLVDKVITSNRMAVFELRFSDKMIALVTDLEKAWVIDDPKFVYREFRATSNDIFMIHSSTKNGLAYDQVYKVGNDELKPVELNKGGDDTMFHQFFDNRIYYTLRNSGGQLSDVCYTDAGSDKVNRIFTGPMTYLFRKNDFLIAGTMTGSDVKIYKASTAELLGEFTNINPIDILTNKATGLWGAGQAVILHDDRIVTQQFAEHIELTMPVPQGILIKLKGNAGTSWHIYDLKRAKITALFKDQPVDFSMTTTGDLLSFADTNDRHGILWDLAKERRVDFPSGLYVSKTLNGDLAIAADLEHATPVSVYSVSGNAPVKMYELADWNDYLLAGGQNYVPVSTTATGFELARIDRDSLYRFPEIVKGPEGITLQEAFHFKGSVYAAAFTYSKGFQVWKMDEMNLTPDDDDELVVTHPETPGRGGNLPDDMLLNAYPNPVTNELNIDLKEGGMIRVIDPQGFEKLKTVAGKSKRLDMKGLPAGQYIIIYSGANGHVVKKVVKL